MADGWAKALREAPGLAGRVELVGLVDVQPGAAERFAAKHVPSAVTGADLDAVLSATRPDLLFDVALPASRRNVVLTGLRHGCHVLTEKPMAARLDEAREIVAAARAADRIHAVTQNRRYVRNVRRIRRAIAEGLLGDVTAIHADFFVGAHFGGFREQMENVLLLDMAIHTFDAARFMAGQRPVSVYCHETNPRSSWYAHGSTANAIFELEGGAIFTYRGSWSAEGANTSWESSWRIIGTRGTLLWDGADALALNVVDGTDGFLRPLTALDLPEPADERETHGHASVIAAFLNAIETGTQPETAGADNIASLEMVLAAIESARQGHRVSITSGLTA